MQEDLMKIFKPFLESAAIDHPVIG